MPSTMTELAKYYTEELINEVIDGLPYELYLWLPQAFGTAVARLMELSKKNVRASFATTAATLALISLS